MSSVYLTGNKQFWVIFTVILLRYLILASIAFLIYYVFRNRRSIFKKIQQKLPTNKDYFREIFYSVVTALIFTVIGFVFFATPLKQITQVYTDINQFGMFYFVFSIALMLIVHDTYFYWTHRWMHRKSVYKAVHQVHHISTNPSPWAAMAFHPIESVIEGMVVPVMAILFPVHPLSIGIFLLIMMIYNVYGHLGYELYPKGFSKSVIGKWINTSINHNMHHQYFTGNYGLYFLWWDRWMGTLRAEYDQHFEEVKSRKLDQASTISSINRDTLGPVKTSRTL